MFDRHDEVITISRQELYQLVWTTPTVTLATRYGCSDVALAKICKKHQIPKPPLGYWARVAAGKKVVHKPLPAIADPQLQQIRIRTRPGGVGEARLSPETKTALATEKSEANRIHVPSQLESPHPLVERTVKSLHSAATHALGLVRPKAKQCLDIAVSRASIDRAMLIMDALVKALERRGYPISVREDGGTRCTAVTVLDEAVHIQLKELLDHKEKDVTPKQREDYLRWHRRPEVDSFPSGRLALCMVSEDLEDCRRVWADGTRQRVEDCLNAFIGGLFAAAEAIKAARAKRERWKREWEEAERQRLQAEQRRWEEEKRIRDLEAQRASWEKSQKIRRFLGAVEEAHRLRAQQNHKPPPARSSWLAWAHRYADSLDPLVISEAAGI